MLSPRPLLAVQGVGKTFGGVTALSDVSFDLYAGEVHALVGENGAGKSTLIRILTGAHAPDTGSLLLFGQPAPRLSPGWARAHGIAAIYQQPALLPDLSVAENIALGLEAHTPFHRISWPARRSRARELLDRVGARIDPEAVVRALSMPEQQLVEIARALGAEARVLIMDEPTASLGHREATHLLALVRELREAGKGIVYISHRLEELFGLADRVTVLRDGLHVATRALGETDRDGLIRLMVGRPLDAVFPKRAVPLGDVVLSVRGLSCAPAGLHDVTFDVRAGEIFGLSGLVGAGRTPLARTLFGLAPRTAGEVLLGGRPALLDSPAAAIALGVAYLPEDRRRHGVIPEMSIAANVGLASLRGLSLDRQVEAARASALSSSLAVKAPSLDTPVAHLSGGNQQKVALARWMATAPRLLILDEPTQGIDVGAKAEIHRLMGGLAEQGVALILISSELPEILGMCDRIGVMRTGRLQTVLSRAEATPERLLSHALGEAA